MQQNAPLSPEPIFFTMVAFQHSAAFKTTIELDLFTRVGEGSRTVSALAQACGAAERGIRILCDTMSVLGYLRKENGEYGLTDISAAFLDRRSSAYMGDAVHFMNSDKQMQGFANLTEAVRHGGSVVTDEGALAPDSPMWVKFAKGMMPMMAPAAQMMAGIAGIENDRKLKILDIAAGHGIFGVTFLQQFPNAEVYAVDWANVLTVATENAEKMGVADRHHRIPGSAFDVEYGDGYDIVLLTNFLHHFDAATNETLLRKVHGCLADGGKVLTLEFVPNEDRVSPPMQALFSLVMLAATPAGDAFTEAELRQMFENAGFARNEFTALEPLTQTLIISSKS
jgi:ubiquinone/menaquinone biosynthesis C-methylase UbiE